MGTCAGQRVLGVLSSRRTFVRTSQLPPPSPPLSPFADSPFPPPGRRALGAGGRFSVSRSFIPHFAFAIPHWKRTLVPSHFRMPLAFDVHSAFRIRHSAFEPYLRTLLQFIPHSAFRIPHWSRPLVPSYAFRHDVSNRRGD